MNSERDDAGDQRDQDTRQALFEAYELLEEYAPIWYPGPLSKKIREALDAYESGSCHCSKARCQIRAGDRNMRS